MSTSITNGAVLENRKNKARIRITDTNPDEAGKVTVVRLDERGADNGSVKYAPVALKRLFVNVATNGADLVPPYHGEAAKVSDSDAQPPDQGEHLDKEPWTVDDATTARVLENLDKAIAVCDTVLASPPKPVIGNYCAKSYLVGADLVMQPGGRYRLVLEFAGAAA